MAKQYFELLNVNHEAESASQALGIQQKRIELLKKEFYYMIQELELNRTTKQITHMLQFCESLEEVIFMSMMIGDNCSNCPIANHGIPIQMRLPENTSMEDLAEFVADKMRRIKDMLDRMNEEEDE